MNIKYVGINSLDEIEKAKLANIAEREYPKITRHLSDAELVLVIKKHSKSGKKSSYSLQARLDKPDLKFRAEANDWEISKAAHMVFEKLNTEMNKKYKT